MRNLNLHINSNKCSSKENMMGSTEIHNEPQKLKGRRNDIRWIRG